LLGDGQIGRAGFPAIGAGHCVDLQLLAQGVDDLFTELARFIQQAQVGRKANGLFHHGGV